MTILSEEALNSLLKLLEEPLPHTSFTLLVPQREQILPTLVSRSICITLPWRSEVEIDELNGLEKELVSFLKTGEGFLDKLSLKGILDNGVAERLIYLCQSALLHTQKKTKNTPEIINPLICLFSQKIRTNENFFQTQQWINEALEMLRANINPARCLEAFTARLYTLLASSG